MILCLDLGNTQLYGGLFKGDKLIFEFRKSLQGGLSSDEWGLFLKSVLLENRYNIEDIRFISLCCVVPGALYSLQRGCFKYFHKKPFVLKPGVKTGLKIHYRNPLELGSDRIANAVAATQMFPEKNLLIIDFGTAITLCAISKDKVYLGGAIMAGLNISMKALEESAKQLFPVEIKKPSQATGRSTKEGLQSGLYYGTLGAVQELRDQLKREMFYNEPVITLGTGGFSHLFKSLDLFEHHEKHLVLKGLYRALQMNC